MDRFTAGEIDTALIAYMRFESNARQIPEIQQLLPMEPPSGEETAGGVDTMYEFTPDEVALNALPRRWSGPRLPAFNDAVVSEQIMRMIAMKAATDNAAGLGRSQAGLQPRPPARITTNHRDRPGAVLA